MQAGCTTFDDPTEVAAVCDEVTRQVVKSELALATRLEFA